MQRFGDFGFSLSSSKIVRKLKIIISSKIGFAVVLILNGYVVAVY